MANFYNTYYDHDEDREEEMEAIIQSNSPADAARKILEKVITPLVRTLDGACPFDCDHCRY